MKGDFKTDITRDSFRRRKHFSRVLMQQGRVQLDADWNEQQDILLHYMRTLASDIIGPHAGPLNNSGFAIAKYTPPPAASSSQGGQSGQRGQSGRGRSRGGQGGQSDTEQSKETYAVAVGRGRYYVDGILCELDEDMKHYRIEDEEVDANTNDTEHQDFKNAFLFYLDVWEREVTYQEDDSIREVALGGPDSATRAQVTCQIRTKAAVTLPKVPPPLNADERENAEKVKQYIDDWTSYVREYAPDFQITRSSVPLMKARPLEIDAEEEMDLCTIPPTSQYRGAENQLYRVEVHRSGPGRLDSKQLQARAQSTQRARNQATQGDSEPPKSGTSGGVAIPYATFKWSRDNGSVVFPIIGTIPPGTVDTLEIEVAGLGRDASRFTLDVDDWVEIIDYEDNLELEAGNLMRVTDVDFINSRVTLAAPHVSNANWQQAGFDTDSNPNKPLLLRRWDYSPMEPDEKGATTLTDDGALEIVENSWLTLEKGVQVLFHRDVDTPAQQKTDNDADDAPPYYHTGDYWLIPARVAIGDPSTGGIEWPQHNNEHAALPPHGIEHHYAPLAYVVFNENDNVTVIDLRRHIIQGWLP